MAIYITAIENQGSYTDSSGDTVTSAGIGIDALLSMQSDFVQQAGVVGVDDLKVVQDSPASASVDVGVGTAYIDHPSWAVNGTVPKYYRFTNDAVVNVPITANASGNPRIDIIVAKIDTSTAPNDSASNVGSIIAIAGTPAGSPVAPSIPVDGNAYMLLATIAVANGFSTIVTANITDNRTRPNIVSNMYTAENNAGYRQEDNGGDARVVANINASNVLVLGSSNLAATSMYNNARFSAYMGSNQVSVASGTVIQFNTENYDPGSNYNTSTYVYTVPVSGIYYLAAQIVVASPTDNNRYSPRIELDSGGGYNELANAPVSSAGTGNFYPSVVVEKQLTAGNLIRCTFFADSTKTLNASSTLSWFQARLVALV